MSSSHTIHNNKYNSRLLRHKEEQHINHQLQLIEMICLQHL
jgi:hypothetical protein